MNEDHNEHEQHTDRLARAYAFLGISFSGAIAMNYHATNPLAAVTLAALLVALYYAYRHLVDVYELEAPEGWARYAAPVQLVLFLLILSYLVTRLQAVGGGAP